MNPAQSLKVPDIAFPSKLFTLYLSHPSKSRKYVREFELDVEAKNPDIALINPFYDVEGEGREDVRARDEDKEFTKTQGYEWRLVRRDLVAMSFSRGIFAVVDENSANSHGTKMEAVYARMFAMNPRILVCTNGDEEHPWYKEHFNHIYTTFDDARKNLRPIIDEIRKGNGF